MGKINGRLQYKNERQVMLSGLQIFKIGNFIILLPILLYPWVSTQGIQLLILISIAVMVIGIGHEVFNITVVKGNTSDKKS